jgi:hypothetical protein
MKIKFFAVAIASLFLMAPLVVQTQEIKMREDLRMVAPALENYTQAKLSPATR